MDSDAAVKEVKTNLDMYKESRLRCHTDLKQTRENIDLKLGVLQKQIEQNIDGTPSKIETLLQSICYIYVDAKEKLDTYEEDIGKLGDAEQFARLELSRKRSNIDMAKLKIIVQDAKNKKPT